MSDYTIDKLLKATKPVNRRKAIIIRLIIAFGLIVFLAAYIMRQDFHRAYYSPTAVGMRNIAQTEWRSEQYVGAVIWSYRSISHSINSAIHWSLATRYVNDYYTSLRQNRINEDVLEACEKAASIIGAYDYEGGVHHDCIRIEAQLRSSSP